MWNTGVPRIHILFKSMHQEDPNTSFTLQNENKEGQKERGIAFPLLSTVPQWGWDRGGGGCEEPGPDCWCEQPDRPLQAPGRHVLGATPPGATPPGNHAPWEPHPRGKWTSSFNQLYPPLPLPKILRYALCFLIQQHSFSLNFRCKINLKK